MFNVSSLLLDDAFKPATPLTNGAITDKQDKTDRQTGQTKSDSIGRTVLQTVAQKFYTFCKNLI